MSDFEQIIDNTQATFSGAWSTSSFQPNYYGTDYRVTNRNASSTLPRIARWVPTLPGPGQFVVEIWLPDGNRDRSNAVTYRVQHDGAESTFVLDQTVTGGYWRALGDRALTFAGTGDEYVEVRIADVAPKPNGAPTYVQADAVRFATPLAPPATAPEVTIKTGRNYAQLVWAPVEGATTYVVSRALHGQTPQPVAELQRLGYLDLSLSQNVTYVYTVTAVNSSGLGPASEWVQVRYASGPPLQAVQGLTVTLVNDRPRLDWQPAFDATNYQVLRAAKSGGPLTVVATVDGTTFTDTPNGEQAYYVVRSANERGPCALSSWQVAWLR